MPFSTPNRSLQRAPCFVACKEGYVLQLTLLIGDLIDSALLMPHHGKQTSGLLTCSPFSLEIRPVSVDFSPISTVLHAQGSPSVELYSHCSVEASDWNNVPSFVGSFLLRLGGLSKSEIEYRENMTDQP